MNKYISRTIAILAALFNIAGSILLYAQVTVSWHDPYDNALGVTGMVFVAISLLLWVIYIILISVLSLKQKK
jgi:uncharacterized protein with PQ loop repeat